MAKVFRVMKDNGAGKPALGESSATLGVRVPKDIAPDERGDVHPNTGGMSVSPNWESLPPHITPERLRQRGFKGASGRNNAFVWRMGEGAFEASAAGDALQLRPDPNRASEHGFIEPSATMKLEAYREALHDTQPDWVIEEPEEA